MFQTLKDFLVSHEIRWPETIAAIALSIQALFLFLQWRIFLKHGETMEKQADTADRISRVFEQQGQILDKQTHIMVEQFKFQRRLEAQGEREKVFAMALDFYSGFSYLRELMATALPHPDAVQIQLIPRAWTRLEGMIVPYQKSMITAIHISQPEKNYFIQFGQVVAGVVQKHQQRTKQGTDSLKQELQSLHEIHDSYKEFPRKMMEAAQPQEV